VCVLLFVFLKDIGLATVWDDHLCYILTPALSAYETERLTGATCCCFLRIFCTKLCCRILPDASLQSCFLKNFSVTVLKKVKA